MKQKFKKMKFHILLPGKTIEGCLNRPEDLAVIEMNIPNDISKLPMVEIVAYVEKRTHYLIYK